MILNVVVHLLKNTECKIGLFSSIKAIFPNRKGKCSLCGQGRLAADLRYLLDISWPRVCYRSISTTWKRVVKTIKKWVMNKTVDILGKLPSSCDTCMTLTAFWLASLIRQRKAYLAFSSSGNTHTWRWLSPVLSKISKHALNITCK